MKLSSHYNKVSIIVTLSVLFFGAVIYFFAINNIAESLHDDHLSEEVAEVLEYINLNKQLPKQRDFDEDQIKFSKLKHTNIATRFYDTVYNNPRVNINRAGRAVEGSLVFKGDLYKFNIVISKESTEYLLQLIAIITLTLIAALLLVLFLTNRYLLKDLWKPFYRILYKIKAYNVLEIEELQLTPTKVDEFKELDNAVYVMSKRVKHDFQNLKHFTENASHEMMTPLAVITSKLDTLIQDETLKQEQLDQIHDIYSAAGKLSRLNQSLLLLVKIENNLVGDIEQLNLDRLIDIKTRQFQEVLLSKDIQVTTALASKEITCSKYLIDILLNNLFSNAIRHNTANGKILIKLSNSQLVFQNTGLSIPLNNETVFDRFEKGKTSDGIGLGLTIVKNICNSYNWDLDYIFTDSLHTFIVKFR
jgi:signal transduction histidine kinase